MDRKILIVEDEGVVALELQEFLEGQGYIVPSTVTSADKVMPEVMAHQPHLIIMDINLKSFIDGIDAAERVNLLKKTPVIFVTAYPSEKIKERALRIEDSRYLVKPVKKEELLRQIKISLSEIN
jgi:DNA-binding response OmpR family regulator